MKTLTQFRNDIVGRKLVAIVTWSRDHADVEVEISKTAFLKAIGGNIPFERDGLHPSTSIAYRVEGDLVILGGSE